MRRRWETKDVVDKQPPNKVEQEVDQEVEQDTLKSEGCSSMDGDENQKSL